MKLLIALYFYILATIQLGLLLGVYHYYRSQNAVKPSSYWLGSLVISVLALTTFGTGIVTIEDVARPEFNFTVSNTMFYIAATLQFLFCRSLVKPISNAIKYAFIASVFIFIPAFEWMRIYGTFEGRTAFMCIIASIFFIWQIIELKEKRRSAPSQQLIYLQYATTAELFFALSRIFVLLASGLTIRQVEQIPQLLILLTVTQLVMNTLSYIALGGYWSEKIAFANVRTESENQEIKSLLVERERLISNLLKANKTAATGALSASIAHELNQPLGASQLNIQFLQKKLSDGNLTAEQNQEVLTALLADNQRAANIIKSLRSIFSDEKTGVEEVDVKDLIQSVLQISNPQVHSKNIEIVLRLTSTAVIKVNRSEVQQVILNLMNNAIEALSESDRPNKTLIIETRNVDDGLELIFSDNGNGVDPEVQPHLFELFNGSIKKTGMGLGLWLCQHIVTRHSGYIHYEDVPDGGARFTVFLPLAQD